MSLTSVCIRNSLLLLHFGILRFDPRPRELKQELRVVKEFVEQHLKLMVVPAHLRTTAAQKERSRAGQREQGGLKDGGGGGGGVCVCVCVV